MNYQLIQDSIVVPTDKKWLKRHGYHSIAIKLYGLLAKAPTDLSDANLAKLCYTSLRTLQEAKRQLVYSGLLEIHKINSNTIVFVLGDKAIKAYAKRIADKEYQRVLRKTLEQMHYPDIPTPIEEDEVTAVYTTEQIDNLYNHIAKPQPISTEEVL